MDPNKLYTAECISDDTTHAITNNISFILPDLGNSNESLTMSPTTSASEESSHCSLPSPTFPITSTSSTGQAERNKNYKPKAVQAKAMYNLRKRQLEIEDRRIKAIMDLIEKFDESNRIQAERNRLLEILIKQQTKAKTTD